MRALVTGATGFIGKRLIESLDSPVVLSRDRQAAQNKFGSQATCFAWKPEEETPPAEAFEGIDAVFHLAGDPVADGRWSATKKKKLRDSRILGTANLVRGLEQLKHRPSVLVSASAVGFYSDRGEDCLTEASSPGSDFLAELCQDWETETQKAAKLGLRVANMRIGVVLGPNGGALQKMLLPFQLGLGSPLGNGKQFMPWIHREDLVRAFLFVAQNPAISGPVNGTAPQSATNREFTKALGKALGRPTFFPPVPGFMLKLLFGEFGDILLHSQRAVPAVLQQAGFEFRFPELEVALADIFARK